MVASDSEYPNKWPDEAELPGFRSDLEDFVEHCHHSGLEILQALEFGLGLPAQTRVGRCQQPVSEARLNYYHPITVDSLSSGKHRRAWPHTDFGVLTLLFQDQAGGLEIENRQSSGDFIPIVRQSPSEVAVYISDTLERLTNGYLKAALHQVTVPVEMRGSNTCVLPERYSVASFVKASRHTSVAPLEQFFDDKTPASFGDITAMQLHQMRVGQLYVDE